MYYESRTRSFLKTISWRFWASLTTIALVFLFTGHVEAAFAVGSFEVVLKLVLYYFHERTWDMVSLGRYTRTPFVLWFTGLPCSGKSTLGRRTYEELKRRGYEAEWLDGDVMRQSFPGTGFSKDERNRHVRRVGFIASLLEGRGVTVVCSFVSPYEEAREKVRAMCSHFALVHVSTPLEACEKRDVKGMYKKARAGIIQQFTGVDDPYEEPLNPMLRIDTSQHTLDESVKMVLAKLEQQPFFNERRSSASKGEQS